MTRVIRIGLVSLGTLANAFVHIALIAIPDASGQYLFKMRVESKARPETG